ncbi:hypothetical protein [Acinetobacter sp. CWB-B33]
MMHLCCGLRFDMADIADQSHTGGIGASQRRAFTQNSADSILETL